MDTRTRFWPSYERCEVKVYDISPSLSESTGVFPGDTRFSRSVAMSFEAGHHLGLSSIATTVHVGAHTDAPSHYKADGESIDKRSLAYYVGPCLVVVVEPNSIEKNGERIGLGHFGGESRRRLENEKLPARVLVRTGSFPNPQKWNSDFASFAPDFIQWLNGKGVRLIGIDTPSIDPEASKTLASHAMVAKLDMAILEGVCLNGVPVGELTLLAQPLKIRDGDAGLTRALLIEGAIVDSSGRAAENFETIECEFK